MSFMAKPRTITPSEPSIVFHYVFRVISLLYIILPIAANEDEIGGKEKELSQAHKQSPP